MISERIIEDYLEQEAEYEDKVIKLKITLLILSVIGLLFFSV
ncbi:hypothetical protein [Gracilimonas sp.]|nr:hypothetical protein [Gracilimonas sp.]